VDKARIKYVQQVARMLLYYGRAVDATVLPALSLIASGQAAPTEQTMERVKQVLDYCLPKDGEPIKLNGAYHTLCSILRFVVASAAEAELGALLLNCQEGMIFKATLEDLDHPQPKIPVHCNNATAVGIANNTIKRQRSRAMEMREYSQLPTLLKILRELIEGLVDCSKGAIAVSLGQKVVLSFNGYWGKRSE
jgi:hypothetical protein